MKPLFIGKGAPFNVTDKDPNRFEKWANLLNSFWEIVAEVYPEIIEDSRDYSLMKTVGVYSLHLFLRDRLVEAGRPSRWERALKEVKKKLLRASREFNPEFWKSTVPRNVKERGAYAGAYSSAVGHRRIAAGLALGKLIA